MRPSGPQRRLAESRQSYNRDDFVGYFSGRGLPEEVAGVVWEAFMSERIIPEFKPKPEDDILHVFRLGDEELDDVIVDIFKRCKYPVPPASETQYMKEIATVSDLVEFVAQYKV